MRLREKYSCEVQQGASINVLPVLLPQSKPCGDVRVFTYSGRGQFRGTAFGQVQEGQQLFAVEVKK